MVASLGFYHSTKHCPSDWCTKMSIIKLLPTWPILQISSSEVVPRGWIWSHVNKEACCCGIIWWDCVPWAFWGLLRSCAESSCCNLTQITCWFYFTSWYISYCILFSMAICLLITSLHISFLCSYFTVPVEDASKRKRGDTKDHPLSQWFMNFSEADELLQLAAARQQVRNNRTLFITVLCMFKTFILCLEWRILKNFVGTQFNWFLFCQFSCLEWGIQLFLI